MEKIEKKRIILDNAMRDHFRCSICGNPIDFAGYYHQECFEKYYEEMTGKSYEDFVNEE